MEHSPNIQRGRKELLERVEEIYREDNERICNRILESVKPEHFPIACAFINNVLTYKTDYDYQLLKSNGITDEELGILAASQLASDCQQASDSNEQKLITFDDNLGTN